MKTLEITKRASDKMNAVACWRVNAEGATPNTEVVNENGFTLNVRIDNVSKRTSSKLFTLNELLNPGKKTKLFGGNKPYGSVEIIVADQDSDFNAEWGFGGPTAIKAIDRELGGIACTIRAYGEYHFRITSYYDFMRSLSNSTISENGEITRAAIRDHLRSECVDIIKNNLSAVLAAQDLIICQAHKTEYCEDIKEQLSEHLKSRGVEVISVVITGMEYDDEHQNLRNQRDKAKAGVIIGKIENEGKKDDISVQDAAADIQVKLIDARGRAGKNADKEIPIDVVFCPRCGTKNEDSRFCKKCGEKLVNPTGKYVPTGSEK